MSRPTNYAALGTVSDPVGYNHDLYGRSERERLRRLNYSRAARGKPLVSSLDEVMLRRPMCRA